MSLNPKADKFDPYFIQKNQFFFKIAFSFYQYFSKT